MGHNCLHPNFHYHNIQFNKAWILKMLEWKYLLLALFFSICSFWCTCQSSSSFRALSLHTASAALEAESVHWKPEKVHIQSCLFHLSVICCMKNNNTVGFFCCLFMFFKYKFLLWICCLSKTTINIINIQLLSLSSVPFLSSNFMFCWPILCTGAYYVA